MCQVTLSTFISAPADDVWETLKDFKDPGKYIDVVTDCTIDGTGVGAVRTVKLQGDAYAIERMVHLDEANRTISYNMFDTSLPLSGYIGIMHVRDLGDNACKLEWSSVFEPKGTTDDDAVAFIENIYAGGFQGLKKRHERP